MPVSPTIAIELDRALLRYGDDLYRLALLLTPDTASATAAMFNAVRRLRETASGPIEERALMSALIDTLPPEQRRLRRRRLAGWARPPANRADTAPLLAAIARLPRRSRLALGLTLLRTFEPAQVAPLLGGDEANTRALVRDALIVLAPVAMPGLTQAELEGTNAPETCRPTRRALALGGADLQTDPAIRGHLALCADCRAAEQTWQQLTTVVEETLRGALRDTQLPVDLAEQLRAAAQPEHVLADRNLLANPRIRIALVALPVLALIAFMVLPRSAPTKVTTSRTAATAPAPRDLVQRARELLYLPPTGDGVWHARYDIQWNFTDSTFAQLIGEQWIDPASGRHRLQLVHHSGGGPYEFELGDGAREAWYAVSASYGPSLYPLSFDPAQPRVRVLATEEQQQQMLRARLQAGAWGLPEAYLRQALTAELHSWGRQTDANGALLNLVSFNGVSPLALPPDAPNATSSQVTVLLAIDETSGALREVREVLGAEGGEQSVRTTWRFLDEEWITSQEVIAHSFNRSRAWNGTGDFQERGQLIDPAFPLTLPNTVTPLAAGFLKGWTGLWLPAALPPGATSALLIAPYGDLPAARYTDETEYLIAVYAGGGRRLEISTGPSGRGTAQALVGGEISTFDGNQMILMPGPAQNYQASISHKAPYSDYILVTRASAFGYTRAEFLTLLRSLGQPTIDGYRAQARLFADPQPRDPAVFDALLQALTPVTPPAGSVRHFVERTFKRHDPRPDPLGDPYHLPRYGGRPELLTVENWQRRANSASAEWLTTIHDDNGTLYTKAYQGPEKDWSYDGPGKWLNIYSSSDNSFLNSDQFTVLTFLGCGGARLETLPDGRRAIVGGETNWISVSCLYPQYPGIWHDQMTNQNNYWNEEPYLADLDTRPLVTRIYLGDNGRPTSIETRVDTSEERLLVESWTLVSDELLPDDATVASHFDPTPPPAIYGWDNTQAQPYLQSTPHSVTITEALRLAKTPLFTLPTSTTLDLTIEASLLRGDAELLPPGDSFSPIDGAFNSGLVLKVINLPRGPDGTILLYEGAAAEFGDYLRTVARWQRSFPMTIQVGGRSIDGWQVTTAAGDDWLLFELEGTLLAFEAPTEARIAMLAQLQRLGPVTR